MPHYTRKEARRAFDEIVEFSGIGDFIDEPLRTYSSGMMLRLAFPVAVKTNPDILIVDEILAVGDHTFQAKCVERIHQFRNAGKTILAGWRTCATAPCGWIMGKRECRDGPAK